MNMFSRIGRWWRHWKRRQSYKNEAQALWREIGLHRMNQILLEETIAEKQNKIAGLQIHCREIDAFTKDCGLPATPARLMEPEKPFRSLQEYVADYSADFERRQGEKEAPGALDTEDG